jgi:hypothetical protein
LIESCAFIGVVPFVMKADAGRRYFRPAFEHIVAQRHETRQTSRGQMAAAGQNRDAAAAKDE